MNPVHNIKSPHFHFCFSVNRTLSYFLIINSLITEASEKQQRGCSFSFCPIDCAAKELWLQILKSVDYWWRGKCRKNIKPSYSWGNLALCLLKGWNNRVHYAKGLNWYAEVLHQCHNSVSPSNTGWCGLFLCYLCCELSALSSGIEISLWELKGLKIALRVN